MSFSRPIVLSLLALFLLACSSPAPEAPPATVDTSDDAPAAPASSPQTAPASPEADDDSPADVDPPAPPAEASAPAMPETLEDYKAEIRSLYGDLTTRLQRVTDKASAEDAVPDVEALTTRIEAVEAHGKEKGFLRDHESMDDFLADEESAEYMDPLLREVMRLNFAGDAWEPLEPFFEN